MSGEVTARKARKVMAKRLNIKKNGKKASGKKGRSTLPAGESLDVTKSAVLSNLFFFWYAGAKASLFPFLTLFFRQLGLTATQTGIVCGTKAVGALLFAPLWGMCAQRFNKRRFVMMSGMFLMIATFLAITLVPPVDQNESLIFCHHKNTSGTPNNMSSSHRNNVTLKQAISITTSTTAAHTMTVKKVESNKAATTPRPRRVTANETKKKETVTKNGTPTVTTKTNENTATTKSQVNTVATKGQVNTVTTKSQMTSATTELRTTATKKLKNELPDNTIDSISKIRKMLVDMFKFDHEKLNRMTDADILELARSLSSPELEVTTESLPGAEEEVNIHKGSHREKIGRLYNLLETKFGIEREELERMSPKEIQDLIHTLARPHKSGRPTHHRKKRSFKESVDHLTEKLTDIHTKLKEKKILTFVIILVVLFLGEFLYGATDRIPAGAWHDFLDNVEYLEKFGQHRVWGLVATAIFAAAIAMLVDNTECLLQFNLNHFMIHFYGFAGLMTVALLIGFCFPMPGDSRSFYKRRRSAPGFCKTLFGDCSCTARTISVFLVGVMNASIYNFLFWKIQDLGGSEVMMGLCVSTAAMSELLGNLLCGCLNQFLKMSGVIILSLILMSAQLVYLSFLWEPWVAIPAFAVNAVTSGLLWKSIIINTVVLPIQPDHNIESHLQIIQNGVGFAVGSFFSGYVYDKFGFAALYRGGAVVLGVWLVLFVIINKCCIKKREKIEYAKLLNDDGDFSEDSEDDLYDSNDWLETAMKGDKIK